MPRVERHHGHLWSPHTYVDHHPRQPYTRAFISPSSFLFMRALIVETVGRPIQLQEKEMEMGCDMRGQKQTPQLPPPLYTPLCVIHCCIHLPTGFNPRDSWAYVAPCVYTGVLPKTVVLPIGKVRFSEELPCKHTAQRGPRDRVN